MKSLGAILALTLGVIAGQVLGSLVGLEKYAPGQ